MSLRVLTDIFSIVNKDLILTEQITSKDITKEESNALIEKVGELIVNTSARVDLLKTNLFAKKAALEEALDTTGNASSTCVVQEQLYQLYTTDPKRILLFRVLNLGTGSIELPDHASYVARNTTSCTERQARN